MTFLLFIFSTLLMLSSEGISNNEEIPNTKLNNPKVAYDARQEMKKARVVANMGPIADPVDPKIPCTAIPFVI